MSGHDQPPLAGQAPAPVPSLQRKIAIGAAWMVGMRFSVNLMGMISTVILARLLTPNDFGVVALAGSAYAFFSLLGQFGFDSALIHMEAPTEAHYNTAWTANILVGMFISTMMFVVAKPAAWFFQNEHIEYVVYAFSLLSLAKGFENIGVVNFRKSLQFRGDFLYFFLPKVIAVVAAVSAAWVLRNYWALVFGMVVSQVSTLLYSHFSQPFRPRFSLEKFHELFSFSRWILLTNGLRYLSMNAVDIILGRIRDAATVGIYGMARQISDLPSTELLAPINRALFPGFASVASDAAKLRGLLTKILSVTALVSIPAALGIFALAKELVLAAFGAQWQAAGPVLAILALAGIINAMRSALGPVLLATGKPRVLTRASFVSVMVILPLTLVLGSDIGALGVAYATLAGTLVTLPVLVSGVRQDIGFGWMDLLGCIWRPLIAALLMLLTIELMRSVVAEAVSGSVTQLLTLVTLGAVSFGVLLGLTWAAAGFPDGAERFLLRQVRARLGRAA